MFLTDIDRSNYVVHPFRTNGETLADFRAFVAGDMAQAFVRCSSQSAKTAMQRVAETNGWEKYLGKKGKNLRKATYSAEGFHRAVTKLAESGIVVTRLANTSDDSDVIFELSRSTVS